MVTNGRPPANNPSSPGRAPWPRRSSRIALDAEASLRLAGHSKFNVRVYDISRHGCKVEFVERPKVDDRVWLKFKDLEALEAVVCWVDGFLGGVEFKNPIHPAVFELLLSRVK